MSAFTNTHSVVTINSTTKYKFISHSLSVHISQTLDRYKNKKPPYSFKSKAAFADSYIMRTD
jgi:hypothetical protein